MWRSFFMAVGIFLVITGAQFLAVEKLVMADNGRTTTGEGGAIVNAPKNNDFKPGEGLPWVLLSSGAVIIIYTFTIPQRVAAHAHHE